MDALTTYRLFTANPERTLERISQDPIVSRDVEYYRENIGNVKSVEEFVENPRLLNFAMTAYGLEEMSFARALITKLLEEGTSDASALANQLADPRYREFAEAFDFTAFGSATTSFTRANQGVIDRFYQQSMESQAGNDNVGARLALYFERKVDEITAPIDVLGDQALLQIFQTALGLPAEMSFSSLERQEEMLTDRLDFSELSDPEFVQKFVNRFIALWDLENPNAGANAPLITSAIGTQQTLSLDVLASVQSLKSRI